jgi:hypothetical protein
MEERLKGDSMAATAVGGGLSPTRPTGASVPGEIYFLKNKNKILVDMLRLTCTN